MGFPSGSDGKESPCSAGDLGSIPGLGRSPRGGHGNPLQYSCLDIFNTTRANNYGGITIAESFYFLFFYLSVSFFLFFVSIVY